MGKEKRELVKKSARGAPNSDSARSRNVHAPNRSSALPQLRLRVTASAESIIRAGHPWLFADSVREQNRDGEPGELAVVYGRQNRFLAIGLFDPDSPIRVRVLHVGEPTTIDTAWWRRRLRAAIARRDGLFDEQTTGYRWINGESDGWPALVLDRYVATLARGRAVLNAFSFSGGFSVYAARGGAKSVTDLDISAHALESAKRNVALNKEHTEVAGCRHETIQADAFEWLAGNRNRTFDLVILDPPSLAKREIERAGAIQAYGRLARSGIAHLRRGGLLVAASCSAHVSAEAFFGAVRLAAKTSRRKFTELQTTGHAPDHPATFPEATYLKCIYLRF